MKDSRLVGICTLYPLPVSCLSGTEPGMRKGAARRGRLPGGGVAPSRVCASPGGDGSGIPYGVLLPGAVAWDKS